MKFIDDKSKGKVNCWNRNYLYAGTLLFVLVNFMVFLCFGEFLAFNEKRIWSEPLDFNNIFISFCNVFTHFGWEHILFNLLLISIGSLYVERKTGTIKYILLILGFSFIAGSMTSACSNSFHWGGSSVVWYALFGYILVDYLFSFQKGKRNLTNTILGAIILAIEYIWAGFYYKTGGGYGWTIVPVQFIYNVGHYVSFFVGMIFALTIGLAQLKSVKLQSNDTDVAIDKKNKIVSLIVAGFLTLGMVACFVPTIIVLQRTSFTVEVIADNGEECSIVYNVKDDWSIKDAIGKWREETNISDEVKVYLDENYSRSELDLQFFVVEVKNTRYHISWDDYNKNVHHWYFQFPDNIKIYLKILSPDEGE